MSFQFVTRAFGATSMGAAFLFSGVFTGCSSPGLTPSPQAMAESTAARPPSLLHASSPKRESVHESAEDLRKLIAEMADKIQSLETKLSSMNDKMDTQKFNLALLTHPDQGKATEINGLASDNAGTPMEEVSPIPHDPEAGFTQDAPVQNFRKALITFQGLKFPEATLAFSDFLEKYPDHPMAGAAQFYIAETYMKQKEFKLALQEYQKILTTYDRCSHLSDTLAHMAAAETILKRSEDAARHRQLLTSLFPLSPAISESEIAPETAPTSEAPPVLNSRELKHLDLTPPGLTPVATTPVATTPVALKPSPVTSQTPMPPAQSDPVHSDPAQSEMITPPPTAPLADRSDQKKPKAEVPSSE